MALGKIKKLTDHSADLKTDGRILLNLILKRKNVDGIQVAEKGVR
jgi:hypothetical protein